jgi:hypothetical protein
MAEDPGDGDGAGLVLAGVIDHLDYTWIFWLSLVVSLRWWAPRRRGRAAREVEPAEFAVLGIGQRNDRDATMATDDRLGPLRGLQLRGHGRSCWSMVARKAAPGAATSAFEPVPAPDEREGGAPPATLGQPGAALRRSVASSCSLTFSRGSCGSSAVAPLEEPASHRA